MDWSLRCKKSSHFVNSKIPKTQTQRERERERERERAELVSLAPLLMSMIHMSFSLTTGIDPFLFNLFFVGLECCAWYCKKYEGKKE
jgi:hypothetical protein